MKIPVRRRGEETGDKTIFKQGKVEETRIPRIKRRRTNPRSNQKRIELSLTRDNLEKGMKEGNT